ncbi:hypothetical protein ACWCPQ_34230 [Nocardia sp. NPDC001965]
MTWRTALALDDYRSAINARFPGRSRLSDGTIGDSQHAGQGSDSDHNPWVLRNGVGVVRAFDLTHDPRNGVDCSLLSDLLFAMAQAGDRRLRNGGYVIFDGLITNADWGAWRRYDGSNPHSSHMHVSFSLDGFDDRGDWSRALPAVALPPQERNEVFDMAQTVRSKVDPSKTYDAGEMIAYADYHAFHAHQLAEQAVKAIADLTATLKAQQTGGA